MFAIKKNISNKTSKSFSAVTPDGRSFELYEDGTWKPESQSSVEDGGFRSCAWGSSQSQVKAMEAAEAEYETSDVLMYRTSVANFPVLVFYNFVDDALIIGNYSLEAKHSSNQAYLHDFWSLKDLLQTKYGESEQSQAYWVDELYKDNVDEWGMAVAAGHAAFFEHWTDGDTQIELQITGDNFEIRVAIIYRSAKLRGLYEKSQKQRALNDL